MPDTGTRPRPGDFELVRRLGPTLTERVQGSPRLLERQRLGRRITAVSCRVAVTGLDQVPPGGPVILAVNHRSFIDGPILFGLLDRVVSFLVKAEAFAPAGGRVGRVLLDGAQIPVHRERFDPAPVRLALAVLDRGGVVGIFPEGTRGDGRVVQARPGVGYLALATGAAVVPVAVHGSAAITRRRTVRRPRVTVTLAPPLHFEKAAHRPLNRQRWITATEQIRSALADLVERTAPPAPATSAPAPARTKVEL